MANHQDVEPRWVILQNAGWNWTPRYTDTLSSDACQKEDAYWAATSRSFCQPGDSHSLDDERKVPEQLAAASQNETSLLVGQ